jgi:hypothetical protein
MQSQTLSNPFVKLSDVQRKPPANLPDLSETEVYCLSEPSVLVSDQTVANLSDINQISNMVENRFKCRHLTAIIIGMQLNFGLEISMNDTNYLISSQHLRFRIVVIWWYFCHSDLFPGWTEQMVIGHHQGHNSWEGEGHTLPML